MAELQKVLILSVSAGLGHMQAARAIKEACELERPRAEVVILDTFRYVNPFLDKVMFGTYIEMLKFTPVVYGYLYQLAERGQPFSETGKEEFNRLLNRLAAPKLIRFLNDFRPQAVVCTHPFPVGILDCLKRSNRFFLPVAATLTDFTVHSFWIFPAVDLFTVAAEELRQAFGAYGVDPAKVYPVGIPINPCFSALPERRAVQHGLGLDPALPTALVVGGGLGMGPLADIVKALGNTERNLQLIVVTGSNNSLRTKLEKMAPGLKNPVRVLGFVDNVHELMAAADFLVGKAGGLTCAEALAAGLPIFIVDPLPGQEVRNADFLESKGVAFLVDSVRTLVQRTEEMLASPEKLRAVAEKAKRLGKPFAARATARLIESLVAEERRAAW